MERILVLTDYDLFAYLMVGLAAFAACDLALGTKLLYRDEWTFGPATVVVISAYIAGQILSAPSDWFFEELIVKSGMKEPAHYLMIPDKCKSADQGWIDRTLFFYTRPLGCGAQARIRSEMSKIDSKKAGPETSNTDSKTNDEAQELFFAAFPVAKKQPNAYERMMIFSRLYIFCRNMAFVALLAAIASIVRIGRAKFFRRNVRISTNIPPWLRNPYTQLAIFSAVAVGLFYRYLFFYRLYSVEVLLAFAFPETGAKP